MDDPQPTATANATSDHAALPAIALAAAVALPALLAGCGGAAAPPPPAPDTSPTLSITSISVRGTSDTAGNPLSVNGNAQPAAAGVAFTLNGVVGGTQLPADPGRSATTREYDFAVRQSGASGIDLTVTINPSPALVMPVVGTSVFARARHLLSRTAFAPSWDDLTALLGTDYNTAVDAMVDNAIKPPVQAPPAWIDTHILSWTEFDALPTKAAQDAYQDSKWTRRDEFKGWLMRECAISPNPFAERLTLFWANHFVVNIDDIEEPQLAWRWWRFLRDNCSGNLKAIFHAMARMPAMVVYLNSDTNTKASPNENFARELMELFTLGEGQVYSEADVVQVARAFTGYSVDDFKNWLYKQNVHDLGTGAAPTGITVLGTVLANAVPAVPPPAGALAGDEAIDLILAAGMAGGAPRTARLIVEKLWAEFIGAPPAPPLNGDPPSGAYTAWQARILHYATILYTGDGGADGGTGAAWDLAPLLKAFFKNADFTAAANIGGMIKTPMELICGFHRAFAIPLPVTPDGWQGRAWRSSQEDQNPLCPPNVKGWLGGTTWINAKTLLARYLHLSWSQWEIHGLVPHTALALRDGHVDWLLAKAGDRVFPPAAFPNWMTDPWQQFDQLLRELVLDPAYQMK
jgi:uncharacterized protein (DUF1800 family)